jgi:6-pyruvoyltetrahydropterin/6-carboxytetrahydropterin synthase
MLRLAKRYPFSASHRLHSSQLSDEENARLFGKCNNPFGHGHNYVLEVSVTGEGDPDSGMLLSRAELDNLVRKAVLDKVDHANLNTDVASMRGVVPTTENLALMIGSWLREACEQEFQGRPVRLDRVRIEETARNTFEVTYG